MSYVYGTDNRDSLFGSNDGDTIYGNGGDDFILGDGGNDFLYGDDGNDVLIGAVGNDTLIGGNGNDILIGSNGNDSFYGGSGNDIFILEYDNSLTTTSLGTDTIFDFTPGEDKIGLGSLGLNSLSDLNIVQNSDTFTSIYFANSNGNQLLGNIYMTTSHTLTSTDFTG
jgi:Ca2+-binding RTX toxin-like protein